ncbi:Methyltransferase domain-containing protein [Paracoccus laeviglucosivorans]|uniref:Methyltransferase domain-containing protein n=2 Tax=Paracoccus laeviglucosivorans TaxID=1197861 RepID=A0A521ECT3_9RHOB|nr:Methyltransferase domain-containing protein [Paracoccus laeviglucosivorans]
MMDEIPGDTNPPEEAPTTPEAASAEAPAPEPKAGAARFAVTYLRENSATWDRARFRKVIEKPLDAEVLSVIAHRRAVLRHYAPHPLHGSYGGNAHAGREGPGMVSSDTLAISPAYGAVLHNLARAADPRLIVEDGAGFGISSMYLAAATRGKEGSTLISFEISEYARLAQASVVLIDPGSRVVQGDFAGFARQLAGTAQIGFAFIDAMHEKDALLRSFKSLVGWMAPKSMIVVDDLSYSESAREGFRAMMRMEHHDFVCIVNKRFGVLIKG